MKQHDESQVKQLRAAARTLSEALLSLENPGEIKAFLEDLCTPAELEAMVDQVLADNPSEVEAFKGGKKKLMGFFVGQVMKKTKGKANPQTVNQLLREKLDK